MSAWVSKVWFDKSDLNSRGKPKRRFTRMEPGVTGVGNKDVFVVQYLDPDERQRQEKIKLKGKPAKRLADSRAAQLTAELTLGSFEAKDSSTWDDFKKEYDDKCIKSKATSTQELYRESLRLFEEICKPKLMRRITTNTVASFRAELAKRPAKKSSKDRPVRTSPANVNKSGKGHRFR